ncbi:MAG: ferritin-like domain-containing protein [Burkholderiales bacterium]|nr:ferritin-like domain-containing protein [Bacteroidia bacterium]
MNSNEKNEKDFLKQPIDRLGFFKMSGVALATTAVILSGCKKETAEPITTPTPSPSNNAVDLGSGDTGVLNYAYALEQLEAAFYTQVMATPFTGMTAAEIQILGDLKLHEIAHREFLKAALGASAIIALTPNFSSIDFTNRASVLGTAKAFEDLGVAAYNGAGKLLTDPNNLLLAGKIVSVEARHASVIRDLLNPSSADFAGDDVVTVSQGLDGAKTPAEVLTIAGTYITNTLDASHLPTT